MSEVRRWDMDGDAQMFENGIGDYVLATDFDLEHQRRVDAEDALDFVRPKYELVLALMRKVGWKYEDSEDLNQKVAFSVYTYLVECCMKAKAHLSRYKEDK